MPDIVNQQLDVDEKTGKIELHTSFTADAFLKKLNEERKNIGKGYSKGHRGFKGTLRKIASIRRIDLMFWASQGDMNAAAMLKGDNSRLNAFLLDHPEFRASEGRL